MWTRANIILAHGGEALRDGLGVRQLGIHALTQQRANRCREGCAQCSRFCRTDVRIHESGESLRGKVVVAARLYGGHPFAEAGERER